MTAQQSTTTHAVDDEQENGGRLKKGKGKTTGKVDTKKVFVGASARVLFYPTLFYNVVRNKLQPDFRWWDEVCEYVLLGAVPFPKDVPRLKKLGVGAVITLNEPFETLVPPSLYKDHGMKHLIIPTRDYLYAPSLDDVNRAVDFIHNNASHCIATYVHCKAGRGRSTTIAICYLVKYEKMTPDDAMKLVRSKRPRVALTSMQLKAVEEYYRSCQAANGPSVSSEEPKLAKKEDPEGYQEKPKEETLTKVKPPQPATLTRLSSFITSLPVAVCQCVSPLPKLKVEDH